MLEDSHVDATRHGGRGGRSLWRLNKSTYNLEDSVVGGTRIRSARVSKRVPDGVSPRDPRVPVTIRHGGRSLWRQNGLDQDGHSPPGGSRTRSA